MSAAQLKMLPLPAQYSHISRHIDTRLNSIVAKLLPGDYYVTQHGEFIATVLGSCVSACVRDHELRIGGMNHFMLPLDASEGQSSWKDASSAATRFGNVAMEMLINDILKLGGRRERLEVKLVGGGRVLDAKNDVGARNIEFVREYVRAEGFRVVGEDLGSTFPRRVLYDPATGNAKVKKLLRAEPAELAAQERKYQKNIGSAPVSGDIELF